MREGIALLAFTETGAALAQKLGAALGGTVTTAGAPGFSLREWTREMFAARRALVFVGAAGIAVRAVAPFLVSKTTDPAVVVVDELGRFAVPLLSGHLGGANALAETIAALCGAVPVITTATDLHGRFAVDLWAKRQRLRLMQPASVRRVSAKILAGEEIRVASRWPVEGEPPALVRLCGAAEEGADVAVDVRGHASAQLLLVPAVLSLGIGCRRGVGNAQIEAVFAAFCRERDILPQGICRAASIDRKREEQGLLEFCAGHGWPLQFFSAAELSAAAGTFSASAFVRDTVGVDNVCERSAVLAGGTLLEKKYAAQGVTLALAVTPPRLDWRWTD